MSDVMVGRARIAVSAQDTIDAVLERVRASEADELVLDVDERSPLLISLQHLHSLDEAAQERGIHVTIASTNSKLLNAARVFGLDAVDSRTLAPATRPAPTGRLLAGAPLGDLDAPAPDAAPPGAERPQAAEPIIRLQPVTPRPANDSEASDEPPDEESAAPPAPVPRQPQPTTQPQPRLDPYGQPYDDDEVDEGEAAGRVRPIPRGNDRRAASAQVPDEEGWEDEPGDLADEEGYYDDEPQRPGLLAGLTAFWLDVRAWVDARRGGAVAGEDEGYAEGDAPDPATDDEGWDEPPYRARQAGAGAAASQADSAGESEAATAAPPVRTIRELPATDRLAPREERATARRRPAIAQDDADEEDERGWEAPRERRGPPRRAAAGSLAIVGGAVLLVVLAILYLLVPSATVTLVARTGSVSTEFKVVVGEIDPNSPQGQPTQERIVVPAKRITVPLTASVTKPATGARLEPDVTAGGPVVLTNASTTAATVPKGTVLQAPDGRGYITAESVTVGAADPFAGAFGTATVKVAAEIKGSGGNAPIDAVRGQLPNGIYYTNKVAPIAGGSDRKITTVAKQDRAAAQAAAEDAMRAKGQGAVNGALPAGSNIMHDTAGVGNFTVTFSAQEGADGDSVTATVAAEATALTYAPSDVEASARAEAERRLSAAAKPTEPVVPGSAQVAAPQIVEDVPGTLTYSVSGTAQTRAAIGGDAERGQLAKDLANKSDDDARAVIARIPGVASATITYSTGPFPQRMPWPASHIRVRVADGR